MGVDFYLHWEGQTEDENRAQITGFATVGDKGYIREAYGGNGEFATEVICPEAWSEAAFGPDEDLYGVLIVRSETDPPSRFVGQPRVSIEELRSRREPAMATARRRYPNEYGETHAQAVSDFIDLADRLVSEGKTVWIYSSY